MNTLFDEKRRKARKDRPHGCMVCFEKIRKGTVYNHVSALTDGSWWHGDLHVECSKLSSKVAQACVDLGWDEVPFCEVVRVAKELGIEVNP